MSAIAIIAPDGNRVVSLSADLAVTDLTRAKLGDSRVCRQIITATGDWPFRFDRVYVCRRSGWRGYRPDDLPAKYW